VSTGRWHQSLTLPSGERVTADYREPITDVMRRAYAEPELSDLQAIVEWARQNRQQIEACQRGDCDHYV
jgi:hypothetical protein